MSDFKGLVVGVDQDEVLYHWNPTFHEDARREYPHINFPFLTQNVSWSLTDGLDEEGVEAVAALMNAPGFYRRLKPIEGAKEALEEMDAEGIHVFIATSPMITNPTCASDKHFSLERDFGHKWAKRAIITEDKTVLDLDFLFDDKPEITGFNTQEGRRPSWEHILFDQPYNRHVNTPLRITHWGEWRDVLEKALHHKYAQVG
jgi:5'-nucleotidase